MNYKYLIKKQMRTIIILCFGLCSVSLIGQRQYTATQITSIDAGSQATEGDLYHDVVNNILYIGLMTGKLVPINNTDDQKIDLFEINSSNILSLSIESDGETPKTVNLAPYSQTLSQSGDVVTLSNGGGSFTDNHLGTSNQTLSSNRTVTQGSFDLNFDANTLVVSGDDNFVGIGTASPSEKLEVIGTTQTTRLRIPFNSGSNDLYFTPNDGTGNMHMYWNSNGTTSPVANEDGNAYNLAYTASPTSYLTLKTAPSVTAGSAQTFGTSMVWHGNGDVGIGVVPTQTLDVNGTTRIRSLPAGLPADNIVSADASGNLRVLTSSSLDDQNLSNGGRTGTNQTIDITNGTSVTFDVADNDNSSTNEIQDLSLTGNTLSLSSDATTVNLAPYLDNTDDQRIDVSTFTAAGLNLSLEGDAEATKVIPLISTTAGNDLTFNANGLYINETDSQNLGSSASGTNRTITISGGASTTISVADNDNDPTNEIQTLSRVGDVVTLSNGGGSFTDDHLGTANQTLTANRTVTQGNFDLNFDANTLVIDGSANNVGIGSTAPTEKLLVAGNIQAGEAGVGSMAMTINDGQGNANLTFNHTRGVPDGNGSSARIVSGVDAASAYLGFELASNVTAGTSVNSTEYLRIQNDGQIRMNDYGTGNFKEDDEIYQLAVDANGDIVEMNTAKSAKIFYPPAIVIDVSSVSSNLAAPGNESINLYTRYTSAFATPAVKSPAAPAAIPTYTAAELDYYITDYDTSVFANVAVTNAGVMTYDVISVPPGNCTYINVVFVVR